MQGCRNCLRWGQFQPFDARRVELAAVRREDRRGFSDDGGPQTPAVTTFTLRRADVVDRVDVETRGVVELVILLPGRRREAVAFGQPDEFGRQLVGLVVDGKHLQLAAVDVAFALVLDFHLAAHEGCQDLRGQLVVQGFLLV